MPRSRSLVLLLLLLLGGCATTVSSPTPHPTRAPVSPELAVKYALDALHADSPTGSLLGNPTVLRGQIMPLQDAFALVNGRPLDNTSPLRIRRGNTVWLVITRGEWLLHVPGAHGDPLRGTPTVLAKNIHVPDLWNAIYFDAVTGEVYEQGGIVQPQIPAANALPALPFP